MKMLNKSVKRLICKIRESDAIVTIKNQSIRIHIDLDRTELLRIKPFIYLLLNNFEDKYFIIIENIPFCLLPDAVNLIFNKVMNTSLAKYFN